VEEALRSVSVRAEPGDQGGVLVLDAIQARGLRFRHLFLIGVNDAFWPRVLDEDPFLPDDVRSRLRDELKRPVPVRGEAEAEEQFLFQLLLSQSSESVTVAFHRMDTLGRAAAPSPYVRELVGRAVDAETLREELDRSDRLGPVSSETLSDLVPMRVALVEASHREGGDALGVVARGAPADLSHAIERGLDQMAAVESFEPNDLRFDGLVGEDPARVAGPIRPTRLERFGRCPLSGFFSQVLRVPEVVTGSATEFEARELGTIIHRVLSRLYAALHAEGLLRAGNDPARTLDVARMHLDRILRESELIGSLLERGHQGVWEGLVRVLRKAIEDFLEGDLEALLRDGVETLTCEESFEHPLDINGESLTIRGTVDRWMVLSTGVVRVSDYKTGVRHQDSVDSKEIDTGRALQLPLYALGIGAAQSANNVEGEILYVPLRPERLRGQRRERSYTLADRSVDRIRAAIARPVDTLQTILLQGRFPFRSGDHCRYCSYRLACRQSHPASDARVRAAEEFRGYYAIAERAE
jgi:ATP-dependent helicase/DNAse subunit B